MISFLFENYGYYPKTFANNSFFIDDWKFKLLETQYEEQDIGKVEQYNGNIRAFFNNKGMYIIKNKNKNFISYYAGKKYVLLSCYNCDMKSEDFIKFYLFFSQQKFEINLIDLKDAWLARMAEIEREGLAALKIESGYYCENLEKILFCVGMCQNAIQYLNDIIYDYGNIVRNAIIVHKRINSMNSFDFFDPFNFVVDSLVRDYVELYRNEYIFFDELVEIFDYFHFQTVEVSLFLARLLYPAKVFDVVEDLIDNKISDIKIDYGISKELMKIKKIYSFFREKYNIHPILWLENLDFI